MAAPCWPLTRLPAIIASHLLPQALKSNGHTEWMAATLTFIVWNYLFMAGLVLAYLKRTSSRINVLGVSEAAARGASLKWLLYIPLVVPGIAGERPAAQRFMQRGGEGRAAACGQRGMGMHRLC